MPYLSANDCWPVDNAAPIMEVVVPRKGHVFYNHYDLFDSDGLKKVFIKGLFGVSEKTEEPSTLEGGEL